MNHRPTAIGMFLCEQVIIDVATRNVTPVNCFNVRQLASFPGELSFVALAWMADGEGDLLAEIVVERLDTMEAVHHDTRVLKFKHRLIDSRFQARIRNCSIPIAGYYQVSLSVDGELVAHRKFLVKEMAVSNE